MTYAQTHMVALGERVRRLAGLPPAPAIWLQFLTATFPAAEIARLQLLNQALVWDMYRVQFRMWEIERALTALATKPMVDYLQLMAEAQDYRQPSQPVNHAARRRTTSK